MHDQGDRFFKAGNIILGAMGLGMILLGATTCVREGRAHEAPSGWSYPVRCCSGMDCNMIPANRVSEGPQGYRIVLRPGDHDFIKHQTSFLVPYSKAEDSPDGEFHICINMQMDVLCLFAPVRGY